MSRRKMEAKNWKNREKKLIKKKKNCENVGGNSGKKIRQPRKRTLGRWVGG